jgi:hypothetical protein
MMVSFERDLDPTGELNRALQPVNRRVDPAIPIGRIRLRLGAAGCGLRQTCLFAIHGALPHRSPVRGRQPSIDADRGLSLARLLQQHVALRPLGKSLRRLSGLKRHPLQSLIERHGLLAPISLDHPRCLLQGTFANRLARFGVLGR